MGKKEREKGKEMKNGEKEEKEKEQRKKRFFLILRIYEKAACK